MIQALGSLAILLSSVALGQTTADTPAFEVADVKVSKSIDEWPSSDFLPGGRVELLNFTMKSLIVGAYNVPDNMVTGAPSWASSDHFDIIAKAPAGAP